MKEYIYFDRDLINSYLAQIDEGILTKLISGQSVTDSHREDGGEEITSSSEGSVGPSIVRGTVSTSKTITDKFNTVYSKENSELIETALDDYSLDILIKKLTESNQLKTSTSEWADGDFISLEDEFKSFDFEQLKESVKYENISNILRPSNKEDEARAELNKLKKSVDSRVKYKVKIASLEKYLKENDSYGNYENILRFANYSSVLFPNTILIKVGNSLAMCTKENIRINTPLLTFLMQTTRKLKILGIVLAKKNESLAPEKGVQLPTVEITSAAPAVLTDIMLENFGLLSNGDYFIRPIAIYFDQK